ncbi:unnamed protein product [Arabidopsis halleri]
MNWQYLGQTTIDSLSEMKALSINAPTQDSTLPSGVEISEEVEKRYNVQ